MFSNNARYFFCRIKLILQIRSLAMLYKSSETFNIINEINHVPLQITEGRLQSDFRVFIIVFLVFNNILLESFNFRTIGDATRPSLLFLCRLYLRVCDFGDIKRYGLAHKRLGEHILTKLFWRKVLSFKFESFWMHGERLNCGLGELTSR